MKGLKHSCRSATEKDLLELHGLDRDEKFKHEGFGAFQGGLIIRKPSEPHQS